MKYEELCEIIFPEIKRRLSSSQGLAICARHRSKFEAWLKVELCGILAEHNYESTAPETDRIDINFEDWKIELKTINTNYRFENVIDKTCPITKNINGIIHDIEKLKKNKKLSKARKAVVFIVFPVKHETPNWRNIHLPKISKELKKIEYREFVFKNKIPGVIYIGLV